MFWSKCGGTIVNALATATAATHFVFGQLFAVILAQLQRISEFRWNGAVRVCVWVGVGGCGCCGWVLWMGAVGGCVSVCTSSKIDGLN